MLTFIVQCIVFFDITYICMQQLQSVCCYNYSYYFYY